jgi:hypothetical protein
MKKGGFMRTIIIILIIVAIIVGLFFFGMSRAPDIIANNVSKKLGVPTSIGSFRFSSSEIELGDVTIGNPSGYSLPKAFSAREMEFEAPVSTYFSNDIKIDEIEVSDIYLGLEFDSAENADGNWTTIFKNLKEHSRLDEKGGKKVFIKRLVFNNIQTELLFRSEGGAPRKLPLIRQIVLTNISTEGGFPTDQVMATVLGQMLKQVFLEHNLNNMIRELFLDSPGKAVDKVLKPFEGFFNTNFIEENEIINA